MTKLKVYDIDPLLKTGKRFVHMFRTSQCFDIWVLCLHDVSDEDTTQDSSLLCRKTRNVG